MSKSITPHHLEKYMRWDLAPNVKIYHNSINNPQYPKKKVKRISPSRVTFTVIGNRVTKEFLECCEWVTALHTYRSDEFGAPIIRGLTQMEWNLAQSDLKLRYAGKAFCSKKKVAVLIGNEFLGDDEDLISLLKKKYVYHVKMNYRKCGIEQFVKFIKNSERQFAYMHIMIDDEYSGSLIFMLYSDLVPLTCDNFVRLCGMRRGGYSGTSVHRIVKDGWVQCGGYGLKDVMLVCENYAVQHDTRGVLSMANVGRYCRNSTQFFITLNPAPWMDQKYVAFGQLVDGDETLKKLENVPTRHESPTTNITLCKVNILDVEPQKLSPCPKVADYVDKHVVNVTQLALGILDEALNAVNFAVYEETTGEYGQIHEENISERGGEDYIAYEYAVDLLNPSKQQSRQESSAEEQRIFYLPFADVPYPGECDSDCDLQFIKAQCTEKGAARPTPLTPTTSKISMHAPSSTSVEIKLDTDEDLDSKDEYELQEYLRLNADRMSFAGTVIRTIARNVAQTNLLANVSLRESNAADEPEIIKFRQRPTGVVIVSPPDRRDSSSFTVVAAGDAPVAPDVPLRRPVVGISEPVSAIDLQDVKKSVRIASWIKSRTRQPSYPERRPTGFPRLRPSALDEADDEEERPPSPQYQRPSALTPLLQQQSTGDTATHRLKDHQVTSKLARKNFFLISSGGNRHSDLSTTPPEKLLRGPSLLARTTSAVTRDNLFILRQGQKLMRRFSSDYVHSRFMTEKENQKKISMRAVEFAKRWPCLSVDEYKRKSVVKEEKPDETAQNNIEESIGLHSKTGQVSLLADGIGVREPGDSPAPSSWDGSSQDLSRTTV